KVSPLLVEGEADLPRLLARYVEGAGAHADHVLRDFRAKIDKIAASLHVVAAGHSIFDQYGRVLEEHLLSFCPQYLRAYCSVRGHEAIEIHELLPAGPNEHYDPSLPPPMNMVSHHKWRPEVRVYACENAQLFLSPTGYQLWNEKEDCFWPTAGSRTYSKLVT